MMDLQKRLVIENLMRQSMIDYVYEGEEGIIDGEEAVSQERWSKF